MLGDFCSVRDILRSCEYHIVNVWADAIGIGSRVCMMVPSSSIANAFR